jgi:hypothetical protein
MEPTVRNSPRRHLSRTGPFDAPAKIRKLQKTVFLFPSNFKETYFPFSILLPKKLGALQNPIRTPLFLWFRFLSLLSRQARKEDSLPLQNISQNVRIVVHFESKKRKVCDMKGEDGLKQLEQQAAGGDAQQMDPF